MLFKTLTWSKDCNFEAITSPECEIDAKRYKRQQTTYNEMLLSMQ